MVAVCLVAATPVLVLAEPAAAAYALLASTSLAGIAAVLAAVAAVRRVGRARRGWALLAAGCASWGAGNLYWSVNELILQSQTLFPSAADAGFLFFPLAGAAALWLISGGSSFGSRLSALLDGLIVAGALFVVLWTLTLREMWANGGDDVLAFVVSVAYPIGDLVLATMAFLLAGRTRRGGRTVVLLLVLGLLGMTVADTLFAATITEGTYRSGQPSDAGWVVAFAAFAMAGWTGRRRTMAVDGVGLMQRWEIALPYAPFSLAALICLNEVLHHAGVDAVQAVALFAGFVMILGRQLLTLLHNTALARRLEHQAHYDPLTGLANRVLLAERLERALDSGRTTTVIYVDLDDFKLVNDSLGHDVGDRVLRSVAERLTACFGGADTVARLGGDEFAIVVANAEDPAGQARRVLESLRVGFRVGSRTVSVRASVGVAVGRAESEGSMTVGDVRKNVDLAMYAAKAQGKDCYAVFDPSMREGFDEEMRLRAALADAIRSGGLHVVYQPIVALADRRVAGLEALARWQHPASGAIGPDVFIPVAERAGLVGELGLFVLERACVEFAAWPGSASAYLSVNVSPLQLLDPHFPARVAGILDKHQVRPAQLVLEVTETAMADEMEMMDALRRLRALGVRIAIDDFGTGYASLRYLHRLPVDIVKIDRSYTQGIAADPHAARVIAALWPLFDAFGLTAVAEGIEDEQQAALLMMLGCPAGQGYLFGRPQPLVDLPDNVDELLVA